MDALDNTGDSKRWEAPAIRINDEQTSAEEIFELRVLRQGPSRPIAPAASMDLIELLRHNAIKHADGQTFWPRKLLQSILTPDRVKRQLQANYTSSGDIDRLSSTVTSTCLRVFAALTLIGKDNDFSKLVSIGITDDALPLQQADYVSSSISWAGSVLTCFDHWTIVEREAFLNNQHRVNPQFLDFQPDRRTIKEEIYSSGILFPFLKEQHMHTSGYGAVSKVKIHTECHGFHDILESVSKKS